MSATTTAAPAIIKLTASEAAERQKATGAKLTTFKTLAGPRHAKVNAEKALSECEAGTNVWVVTADDDTVTVVKAQGDSPADDMVTVQDAKPAPKGEAIPRQPKTHRHKSGIRVAEDDAKGEPEAPADPLAVTSKKTKGGVRGNIFGHPATSIIRWLAKTGGADFTEIRYVMNQLGVKVSDATIRVQSSAAKNPDQPRGPAPRLEAVQSERLRELIKAAPKPEAKAAA